MDIERPAVRVVEHGGVPVKIEVVRSVRRHRTVAARPVGGVLRISIPAAMSVRQEDRWVREMVKRHVRSLASSTIDLEERACTLSRRYQLPIATSVRWTEMDSLWGSCTMDDGSIRISSRVASFPSWVLDYLLVHELAHLVVGDHSPAFWAVVNRYPKTERARRLPHRQKHRRRRLSLGLRLRPPPATSLRARRAASRADRRGGTPPASPATDQSPRACRAAR